VVDLIERIGPFLGIAAFLGLSILAFLIFQQAREVRRLREWAGRAPERKSEADEAVAAATEARGDQAEAPESEDLPAGRGPSRFHRVREWGAQRFAALDRRLPVDPRYLLAVLAAAAVAAAVLTSGFGIFGADGGADGGAGGGGQGGGKEQEEQKIEVAILNATQEETSTGEIAGVPGLADLIGDEVVKPAGYNPGEKVNAAAGLAETTIFVEPESEQDADDLAAAISDQLGEVPVSAMIPEVRDLSGDAQLALVIGRDDAEFAGN